MKEKEAFVYSLFLSLMLGMEMGLFNIYNLFEIIKWTYNRNVFFAVINKFVSNYIKAIFIIVIVMGSFSLGGIVLLNEIRNVKVKWFKNIISIFFSFSFTISLVLMFYGTAFKINISLENKTKYEIITNLETSYIVLSEYEDKLLAIKYQQENENYVLLTNEYFFLNKYEYSYDFINMKQPPTIKK